MDRLSTGEKISGASAVLLFIFMFFDWFSVEASAGGGDFLVNVTASGNAWDALDNIPIFLLIVIVFTVGVVGLRLADAVLEPAIPLSAVVAVAGAISMLLIFYRIIDPPGVESGVDISPTLGIFLSLVAAGGITYGGYRAMQEEGSSFGDIGDRLSGDSGDQGGAPPPPPPPSDPPPPPSSPPPPPPSS